MDQRRQSYRSSLNLWLRFPFMGKPDARAFGLSAEEAKEVEAETQISGEGHPAHLWTSCPGWKIEDQKTAAVVSECQSQGVLVGYNCICDTTGETFGVLRQSIGSRVVRLGDRVLVVYSDDKPGPFWKVVELL